MRVVVVGAGDVGTRKIASLLSYGARVRVIAPETSGRVAVWAQDGTVEWEPRAYERGDLAGARYVVCAANDEAVNRAVFAEADEAGVLVNVVDVPELCSAIVPAVTRRGKLQIAVSTAGAAPSVARGIRRELDVRFGAHWEPYLDVLAEMRARIKREVPGPAQARTPLYEALSASDLEERFERGERPTAPSVYETYVAPLLDAAAGAAGAAGAPLREGGAA